MSYVESQAVFEARVKAVGLSDEILKAFIDGGVKTLATLAFISDYNPGSQSEKSLIETFDKLLKRDSSVAERACLRRLFHEAYALVTAELKLTVEKGTDEASTRKLSQPERNDRYESQVKKLSGMKLRGPHEPADALVDLACQIYEENRLRWISWEKCISKEQELMGDKKEQAFTVSGNILKLEAKAADAVADTSSEILLNYALTRRSLAMDQANLVDFTIMQSWTEKIIKARVDVPPPGFQRPSMKQLMAADVKLFEELADLTRSGVQASAHGRPLDTAVPKAIYLPEVSSVMQPLPSAGSGDYNKVKENPGGKGYVRAPYGKGKGKGKGKKGKGNPRMPVQLLGCYSHTMRGDPICYSFNLECCNEKVERGRCPKGLHVCCAPKCGQHHPAIKCDKRPKST